MSFKLITDEEPAPLVACILADATCISVGYRSPIQFEGRPPVFLDGKDKPLLFQPLVFATAATGKEIQELINARTV